MPIKEFFTNRGTPYSSMDKALAGHTFARNNSKRLMKLAGEFHVEGLERQRAQENAAPARNRYQEMARADQSGSATPNLDRWTGANGEALHRRQMAAESAARAEAEEEARRRREANRQPYNDDNE